MRIRPLANALRLTLLVLLAMTACTDVPIDDERSDRRLFPAGGVIRGSVTYIGPPPCSRDGHIVGNALVVVSDRRNPLPPAGFATSALNFVAVTGDILFTNEPRYAGKELFCPPTEPPVTVSAPFTIAPVDGGSYALSAFYDRRGRFWPTLGFRNQPEAGDLSGGYVDLDDARKNAGNPNYQPVFLPVDVGTPQPSAEGAKAGAIPDFTIGSAGYVADNVPVTIGSVVPFTRPYFYPVDAAGAGADSIQDPQTSDANPTGDPYAVPIVAMTQDAKILAAPTNPTPSSLTAYQAGFRSLKLAYGVAPGEGDTAIDPNAPFGLQLAPLPPKGNGGLLVFGRGVAIAENPAVPALWPQVAFVKLASDPLRRADPQSLVVQGTPQESVVTGKPPGPFVIVQGITLLDDSLLRTIVGPAPTSPTTAALRDHVTVLIRPAALCFDPRHVEAGALLATPHFTAPSADASEKGDKVIVDPDAVVRAQPIVREVKEACLPPGRYAITLVYPTGQVWTVPNEIGGCARSEGDITRTQAGGLATCAEKPRPVLLSQGARAVLEIVEAEDPATCAAHPVPDACTKL